MPNCPHITAHVRAGQPINWILLPLFSWSYLAFGARGTRDILRAYCSRGYTRCRFIPQMPPEVHLREPWLKGLHRKPACLMKFHAHGSHPDAAALRSLVPPGSRCTPAAPGCNTQIPQGNYIFTLPSRDDKIMELRHRQRGFWRQPPRRVIIFSSPRARSSAG